MRAHVSCGSKVVLLVGLIFVLSCIALALATSSLQLTQSVVLEGASKDAQCPSFTLLSSFFLSHSQWKFPNQLLLDSYQKGTFFYLKMTEDRLKLIKNPLTPIG